MVIALRSFVLALSTVALAGGCATLAPNLCERKVKHFARCAGGDAAYSEPNCEEKLARCGAAEKAQIEAYVACLESQNECSLDATARCGDAHPGGVSPLCSGH